jgi:hypothetical protein
MLGKSRWRHVTKTPNEITSANGGWRVLFAFIAQWPAVAEFLRSASSRLV